MLTVDYFVEGGPTLMVNVFPTCVTHASNLTILSCQKEPAIKVNVGLYSTLIEIV